MEYTFTTQTQVRKAFWQGWPESFQRGKQHNEYNATIRSEFSLFVDMLARNRCISNNLANKVTL